MVPQAAAARTKAEKEAEREAHLASILPEGWQNMQSDEVRGKMNPLIMSSIDQLGKFEKFPSQLPTRLGAGNGPTKDEIQSLVPMFYPGWTPLAAENREKFVSYMQPDKDGGKTMASISNASQHATEAADAFNEMRNGKIPWANKLINRLKTENGWGAETSLDTVVSAVGTELAKAIAGASDTGISEREAHREILASWRSPEQFQGALTRYGGMFQKRLNTVYAQAKNVGLTPDDVNKYVGEEGMKALKGLSSAINQKGGGARSGDELRQKYGLVGPSSTVPAGVDLRQKYGLQ
jgi:hypothetical protein